MNCSPPTARHSTPFSRHAETGSPPAGCVAVAGGIRFGRVVKPEPATHGFSVDVVEMENIVGPHHTHPNGEIDMVMPLTGNAKFDGHGAGWVVYGPGSAHRPTVTDGKALVLYLLPQGAIEFTKT